MKDKYYTAYEYGMGSVVQVIRARSEREIIAKYPNSSCFIQLRSGLNGTTRYVSTMSMTRPMKFWLDSLFQTQATDRSWPNQAPCAPDM